MIIDDKNRIELQARALLGYHAAMLYGEAVCGAISLLQDGMTKEEMVLLRATDRSLNDVRDQLGTLHWGLA